MKLQFYSKRSTWQSWLNESSFDLRETEQPGLSVVLFFCFFLHSDVTWCWLFSFVVRKISEHRQISEPSIKHRNIWKCLFFQYIYFGVNYSWLLLQKLVQPKFKWQNNTLKFSVYIFSFIWGTFPVNWDFLLMWSWVTHGRILRHAASCGSR